MSNISVLLPGETQLTRQSCLVRCLVLLGLEDLHPHDESVAFLVQLDPPPRGFVDDVRIVIIQDDPVPLTGDPAGGEARGVVASAT